MLEDNHRRPRLYETVSGILEADNYFDKEKGYEDFGDEQKHWEYWNARLKAVGENIGSCEVFSPSASKSPAEVESNDDRVDGQTNSACEPAMTNVLPTIVEPVSEQSASSEDIGESLSVEDGEKLQHPSFLKPVLVVLGVGLLVVLAGIIGRRR